jgi:hypothetical protein
MRDEKFDKDSVFNLHVDEMDIFNERNRYEIHWVPAYNEVFSQLPGYKPLEYNSKNFSATQAQSSPFIPDIKTKRRYDEWKKKRNKWEIKQLMKLNKNQKNRAAQLEKEIDNIGVSKGYTPDIFVTGK